MLRIQLAALAIALIPTLVEAAPLPESLSKKVEGCRCHAKGYPRCDCGQGEACRCITVSGNPLPLSLRMVLAAAPKRLSGIYEGHSNGVNIVLTVVPLREPNHFHVTWHYDGQACYQSVLRRTGLWTAVENWRDLSGHNSGSLDWRLWADGVQAGALVGDRLE